MLACCIQSVFGQYDNDDDHMNGEMTEQLNFGGGFLQKKASTAETDEDPDRHRTKKEVGLLHMLYITECGQLQD